MKKALSILFLLIVVVVLIFFSSRISNKNQNNQIGKLKISTSFYPLYFIVTAVGGDLVSVVNITPPGAEPHEYEITNQDILSIKKSQLLVITGVLEPWSDKISQNLVGSNTQILNLSKIIKDKTDPHFWLSPKEYSKAVDEITLGLFNIDPKNKSTYASNARILNKRLSDLDTKFSEGLTNCTTRDFVTSHSAFGYLAKEYNLHQVSIAGISPEEEPSLKQLAEVSQFAKQNNVKYIFFESLLSPKLSDTIAKEVGAKTLVLNPLEGLTGSEIASGQDYITVMEENLQNLKIALQCP